MQDIVAITKALSEVNRLRVLMALDGHELCVCQITELLGLANSSVSKHMAILRQARLVESWKDGRWVHYKLAGKDSHPAVRGAITWARKWLATSEQVKRDASRLEEILRMDKEELCRRQAKCQK
jgi:DNA-binding transcriptional ArsR family regulator